MTAGCAGCASGDDRQRSGRCRLDQRPAEVVRPGDHSGEHEEVPTPDRADVVDQRLTGQPLLDRLELADQVLLVAGEDQALVEVAVDVEASVVVEAAAQDPAGSRLRRTGSASRMWAVVGMITPSGSSA